MDQAVVISMNSDKQSVPVKAMLTDQERSFLDLLAGLFIKELFQSAHDQEESKFKSNE